MNEWLFYGAILLAIQESLFPLLISGILMFNEPVSVLDQMDETFQMKFTYIASYVVGVLSYILAAWYFIVSWRIMTIDKEKLRSQEVRKYYKVMFEDLRVDSTLALSYNVMYITRRVAMSLVFLFWSQYPGQQILFALYTNLVMNIYVGKAMNFNSRLQNL